MSEESKNSDIYTSQHGFDKWEVRLVPRAWPPQSLTIRIVDSNGDWREEVVLSDQELRGLAEAIIRYLQAGQVRTKTASLHDV